MSKLLHPTRHIRDVGCNEVNYIILLKTERSEDHWQPQTAERQSIESDISQDTSTPSELVGSDTDRETIDILDETRISKVESLKLLVKGMILKGHHVHN